MADNATGIGYAHTMPDAAAPRIQPPPRQPVKIDSAIDSRWTSRWEPWCALASKIESDPAASLSLMRTTHRSRCVAALDAGLAWTVILRSEIDSPLNGEVWYNAMLRLSVERRRARLGRMKGRGKKYAHKRRSGSEPSSQR